MSLIFSEGFSILHLLFHPTGQRASYGQVFKYCSGVWSHPNKNGLIQAHKETKLKLMKDISNWILTVHWISLLVHLFQEKYLLSHVHLIIPFRYYK